MTECRIFKPTKSAMQSGRATLGSWVLEFEQTEPKKSRPTYGLDWFRRYERPIKIKIRY